MLLDLNDRVDWPRSIVMWCPVCREDHHPDVVCRELELLLWPPE